MTTLRINHDYSYLMTPDSDLKQKLWTSLRFKKRNYFMNPLYKQHLWDGYYDFFNKQSGKFLTGLLTEVTLALWHLGIQYETIDERSQIDFTEDQVDDQFMNQWLPEGYDPITLYDYQVDFINLAIQHRRGIVDPPTGSGKAQPLDSLVLMPTGFRKMGELKIGDLVCVPSGGYAPITGIFPQGLKQILKITFTNGDSVKCCEDHSWKVNATYDNWSDRILTAGEMHANHICPSGAKRYNISVPKKADLQEQKVLLDPYLLGLLLGDGCLTRKNVVSISTIEPEIVDYINKNLLSGYALRQSARSCDYRITIGVRGKGTPKNPYVLAIADLGLIGKGSHQKFVPKCYLYNTYETRLAVLRGLMDTDGYVSKKGETCFYSTSSQLANDVKWLAQSLGGIARIRTTEKYFQYKGEKKKGKLCYVVAFTMPEGVLPFQLSWKVARCKLTRVCRKNRTIEKIEPLGYEQCQCIMVDHPDHMYITDNFVPTHNTNIMLGIMKALPPNTPILFLANRKQVVRQNYKAMLKWGFKNVGIFNGDVHEPNLITCANVQSVHHLGKLLPKFKALIVDEVHRMASDTAVKAYRKLTGCGIRIGISATPFKFEQRKKNKVEVTEGDKVHKYTLKGFFGPVFQRKERVTTEKLQERGILSKSQCFFYPIDEPQNIHFDIYQDAVTNGVAQNWHFHQVVKHLVGTLKGRTLILVERLAHGDTLNKLIPGSLWVQGKDDDETREYVIQSLTNAKGNVVAIATQQIFSDAINVFIHNFINAAGGKAEHDIIQRMGRGLRTANDKEILTYYDFLFRINNYLEDHSRKRIRILKEEGHEIIIKDKLDFLDGVLI